MIFEGCSTNSVGLVALQMCCSAIFRRSHYFVNFGAETNELRKLAHSNLEVISC